MKTSRKDLMFKVASALHRTLYRRSRGRIGGRMAGSPVLLLTTTGRRSGAPRTTPLLYLQDGDRFVVVASKGGDDRMPLWYRNLAADAEVAVEVGADVGPRARRMRASTASGDERTDLWRKVVAMYPPYDRYQARTRRRIPLVILSPR